MVKRSAVTTTAPAVTRAPTRRLLKTKPRSCPDAGPKKGKTPLHCRGSQSGRAPATSPRKNLFFPVPQWRRRAVKCYRGASPQTKGEIEAMDRGWVAGTDFRRSQHVSVTFTVSKAPPQC